MVSEIQISYFYLSKNIFFSLKKKTLKNVKSILHSWAVQKQVAVQIWPDFPTSDIVHCKTFDIIFTRTNLHPM